jgi:hypothetical protein
MSLRPLRLTKKKNDLKKNFNNTKYPYKFGKKKKTKNYKLTKKKLIVLKIKN